MKIITEEQAPTLTGLVEVIGTGKKLYPLSQAKSIASRHSGEGTPLLCEYIVKTSSNRTVKRYLTLIQKRKVQQFTTVVPF